MSTANPLARLMPPLPLTLLPAAIALSALLASVPAGAVSPKMTLAVASLRADGIVIRGDGGPWNVEEEDLKPTVKANQVTLNLNVRRKLSDLPHQDFAQWALSDTNHNLWVFQVVQQKASSPGYVLSTGGNEFAIKKLPTSDAKQHDGMLTFSVNMAGVNPADGPIYAGVTTRNRPDLMLVTQGAIELTAGPAPAGVSGDHIILRKIRPGGSDGYPDVWILNEDDFKGADTRGLDSFRQVSVHALKFDLSGLKKDDMTAGPLPDDLKKRAGERENYKLFTSEIVNQDKANYERVEKDKATPLKITFVHVADIEQLKDTTYVFPDPSSLKNGTKLFVGLEGKDEHGNLSLYLNKKNVVIAALKPRTNSGTVSLGAASTTLLTDTSEGGAQLPRLGPKPPLTPPDHVAVFGAIPDSGKAVSVAQLKIDGFSVQGVPALSFGRFRGDFTLDGVISSENRDPQAVIAPGLQWWQRVGARPRTVDGHVRRYTVLRQDQGLFWSPLKLVAQIPQTNFAEPRNVAPDIPADALAAGAVASPSVRRSPDRNYQIQLDLLSLRSLTAGAADEWPGRVTFGVTPVQLIYDELRRTPVLTAPDGTSGRVNLVERGWRGPLQTAQAAWEAPLPGFMSGIKLSLSGNVTFFGLEDRDGVVRRALRNQNPFDLRHFPNTVRYFEAALAFPIGIKVGDKVLQLRAGYRDGFSAGQSYYDPFALNRSSWFFETGGKF